MKKNVLFLCTGNSCRSIMGEALLRAHAGDRFNVYSAGTKPKGVNPITIQVLDELGIDTSVLQSKSLKDLPVIQPDYVIVVCHDAQESCPRAAIDGGERLFWPFDDPPAFEGTPEQKLQKFREVRDQIDAKVREWSGCNSLRGQ